MKKIFLALALAGAALGASAQDAEPVQQYSVATNSFWSNWFVQAGGDWNVWYSAQEHHADNHNGMGFFGSERRTFGASLALGKWFTPGIGLRTKLQAWQGKRIPALEHDAAKFDAWILNEHVMLNLSNLFCGYSDTRVWNLVPFLGGGVSRNMSRNTYAMQLSMGLQSSWRVSRKLSIYLEGGWNRLSDDFDGATASAGAAPHQGPLCWENKDNHVYGEVGLTLRLGRGTWNRVPDVEAIQSLSQSQLDALNAQLGDAQAENARLQSLLDEQSKPQVEETVALEPVSTVVSVFFNLGRSEIASRKDLVNVEPLARYGREGRKLVVTGYADSATGNVEVNRRLSEARANTVARELEKLGVSRDNIVIVARGGVADLSPVSYNRRATVELAK